MRAEERLLHPIDGLRSRKWEFVRFSAQTFADEIPPNIDGGLFKGVRRPEDVVVIAHLPEGFALQLLKFKTGALLKEPNRFSQVRITARLFGQEMDVIREDAVRMDAKEMADRAF